MDIVRFSGGLGNQMFQYAFMEALKARGREVKASLGYYDKHPEAMRFCLCDVFPNIKMDCVSNDEFDKIDAEWIKIKQDPEKKKQFLLNTEQRFFWVENPDFSTFIPDIFKTKNCTFVGCWQTEKYFENLREVLLQRFEFRVSDEKLLRICSQIKEQEYISIHIRRGDYLKLSQLYGNICTKKYYEEAIEYMKQMVKECKFAFFSDDIEWVKMNFAMSDAIYCEHDWFKNYEDWYDMYLMSQCSHNIIANSSFSWWGAWLNQHKDKIVIAPNKWSNNDPMPDIYAEGWTIIGG